MRKDSKTKGEIQKLFIKENNLLLNVIPLLVIHAITPFDFNPIYLIKNPTEVYNYNCHDDRSLNTDKMKYKW